MKQDIVRSLLVLAAVALMVSAGRAADPATLQDGSAATAFVGVTVLPMTRSAPQLADYTVIVTGDRITRVGPRASTPVPENARRVDGTGKYLMPGLSDMHVHLEYTEDPGILAMFLANGVTTVRNMDGRPFIVEWKKRIASGALLGPSIYTAGPLLDGDPPLRPDNTVV